MISVFRSGRVPQPRAIDPIHLHVRVPSRHDLRTSGARLRDAREIPGPERELVPARGGGAGNGGAGGKESGYARRDELPGRSAGQTITDWRGWAGAAETALAALAR